MAITLDQPNRVFKALTGRRKYLCISYSTVSLSLSTDILNSFGIHSDQFYATIKSLNEEQLGIVNNHVELLFRILT